MKSSEGKKPVKIDEAKLMELFDMTCDICKPELKLRSLQHAKMHYSEEHGDASGYIKCCDIKFRELYQISKHLEFHENPDIFK